MRRLLFASAFLLASLGATTPAEARWVREQVGTIVPIASFHSPGRCVSGWRVATLYTGRMIQVPPYHVRRVRHVRRVVTYLPRPPIPQH